MGQVVAVSARGLQTADVIYVERGLLRPPGRRYSHDRRLAVAPAGQAGRDASLTAFARPERAFMSDNIDQFGQRMASDVRETDNYVAVRPPSSCSRSSRAGGSRTAQSFGRVISTRTDRAIGTPCGS